MFTFKGKFEAKSARDALKQAEEVIFDRFGYTRLFSVKVKLPPYIEGVYTVTITFD